eukprot:Gb_16344 [translate_table: standard]
MNFTGILTTRLGTTGFSQNQPQPGHTPETCNLQVYAWDLPGVAGNACNGLTPAVAFQLAVVVYGANLFSVLLEDLEAACGFVADGASQMVTWTYYAPWMKPCTLVYAWELPGVAGNAYNGLTPTVALQLAAVVYGANLFSMLLEDLEVACGFVADGAPQHHGKSLMKGVYIFMGVLLGRLHLWQVVNIHGHENLMVHNTVERLILKIYYVAGMDDSSAVMVGWAMENMKQRQSLVRKMALENLCEYQ